MRPLGWWIGANGNLFADHYEYRYSIGQARDGSGFWVARNGRAIGDGLLELETAKKVAQDDASAREEEYRRREQAREGGDREPD
jgi:hypothetical protein